MSSTERIVIIDYGMGNLHSVAKAVEKVSPPNTQVIVSDNNSDIDNAHRVIFPGVGAIRDCMQGLNALDLEKSIKDACLEKPVLGICVGMQALCNSSEENGLVDCLGFFDYKVEFFGHDFSASASSP